ncbi:putative ribonuclease H-like domain-containing protein, partial [Tanacetum coccineum]
MTEDEQVLHDELKKMIAQEVVAKALDDATRQASKEEKRNIGSQKRAAQTTSINKLSTGRSSVSTATTPYVSAASTPTEDDSDAFSNAGIFNGAYDDENVGVVANFNNMDDTINVSPIPTLRIHKNHPKDQILGDPKSAVQIRGTIQKASLAQQALFKLQKVWVLVDLPSGKKAIGTKWVFKNKRDERSIVVKNKARLVAQDLLPELRQLEEVYVHQPPGFVDPAHLNKVYKVIKALYGLHQAPRA